MKLTVKKYDIASSVPRVILHGRDCVEIGVKEGERVRLEGERTVVAIVSKTESLIGPGEVLMPQAQMDAVGVKENDEVKVIYSPRPDSVRSICKKMDGGKLSKDEINEIVSDIKDAKLSQIEISAWITALYIKEMDIDEIAELTMAMVNTGDRISFERSQVFDFHSIGGVPGNKVTPIIVSIAAAAGLLLPKTSSRAISSACGTSDFVETFCNVVLDATQFKSVTEKTGGAFAWGGSMNLSPVDDIAIRVQHPLGINPRAQMLAAIVSKKLAVGATDLLIDIPMGSGTKVTTIDEARAYVRDFTDLGSKLGIHVQCAITYGDQPVGSAIGPALEARECIRVLEGYDHPASVIEKACQLAGMILEMGGIPNGVERAANILRTGEALKKFRQIVAAQGGDPDITSEDIKIGRYKTEVLSTKGGYINGIANKDLVQIARAAGAPNDKGAGLLIMKKKGQRVEKGEVLIEIYSDVESKCQRAKDMASSLQPIRIEGMLIERGV